MRRSAGALVLITTLVGLGGAAPAVWAQVQPTPGVTTVPTATTTTTPKATTTTTVPKATTTTTKPKGTTTTTVPKGGATTTTTSTTVPSVSPAQIAAMEALANSVKRSAPSNDIKLLAALAPIEKLGYTDAQAEVLGMGQFPIAGPADYTDDWLEYRATPTPHNHMGIDIDAALGTPIRSPAAGTLTYDTTDPDGYGLAADVTAADKTLYVMAHMSAEVKTLGNGSAVTQGEVIGYVGESGDATGPHLHIEIHPNGGAGIDAKPILDAWQAAAIQAIPALVTSLEPTTTTTSTTVAPLQAALPRPAAFSPPLAGSKKAAGSLVGLALVALLAFIATTSASFAHHRPWPFRVRPALAGVAAVPAGPGEPPAVPPMPAH